MTAPDQTAHTGRAETGTTYTEEGWKALNRAARAYNQGHAHGDPKLIELARDVFHFVLRRVNKDCVVPREPARSPAPPFAGCRG